MQRYWLVVYAAIFILAAIAGAGMVGQSPGNTNVDWFLVAVSFVVLLAFPPQIVSYAVRRKSKPLQRASFSRGIRGDWWADPLQLLRVSILVLGGLVLGSLRSIPDAHAQSAMVIWWQASMLLGLLLGERIVYVLFRKQIL